MSTEFFNDQWRIPSNENQNKVSNYSMDFDGSSDFINCGDSDKFSFGDGTTDSPFSLSGWVKPDDLTRFRFINKWSGSLGYEYHFSTGASDQLAFIINSLGTASRLGIRTSTLTSTDWQHWVATYDGTGSTTGNNSGMKIYINGVEVTTSDLNSGTYVAMQNTTAPLKIGTEDNNFYYANGKIDQVTVFDYALSATQVSTLYGGGTAVTNPMSLSPKPIAYYQLGDQSVSTGPTSSYLVPNNSLSDYVFDFDGNNQYLQVPDSNDLSFGNGSTDSPFSISAWINMDSNASFRIVNKYDAPNYEYQFDTSASGELRFFVLDGTGYRGRTSSTLNTGQWYHVVATYSGVGGSAAQNGTKIYVNGANVVGSTSTFGSYTAMSNTTAPVYIGKIGTSYSNGKISNAAIFNTELSSTQVQTIYNNGSPNDISSLSPVAWYKLNAADTFDSSTSTWTITDYGSGGNDGTSFNMTSASLITSDLQKTNGFSPYALDFDGVNDYLDTPQIDLGSTNTISFWINNSATNTGTIFGDPNAFGNPPYGLVQDTSTNNLTFRLGNNDNGYWRLVVSSGLLNDGNWHHHCLSRSGVTINYYIDGILQTNVINNTLNASAGTNTTIENIMGNTTLASFASGKLSNVALWNTNLSSTEVTEIYNEGVPSNLNNFSGTAPVSWWQLGSNSSYNSGAWTCLDEIGTNNAVSANMTNDDIVDGVGYSASGIGTSSIDIKGNAPYSTANGLSNSMDVLDRTTDVPS